MLKIRLNPESVPEIGAEFAGRLVELLVRASGMGLLSGETVESLDAASVRRVLDAFVAHGLLRDPAAREAIARPLMDPEDTAAQHRAVEVLDTLLDTLAQSPLPTTEWPAMREVLGDPLLCELLGVSPVSVRRYAQGERATPQTIAERLHFLAMTVSDLAGGYNDYGIRRWFERPRSQLAGATPRRHLGDAWSVDGEPATDVRRLAATVSGARAPVPEAVAPPARRKPGFAVAA